MKQQQWCKKTKFFRSRAKTQMIDGLRLHLWTATAWCANTEAGIASAGTYIISNWYVLIKISNAKQFAVRGVA